MKRISCSVLIITMVCLVYASAFAASQSWTGGSPLNGNWGTNPNWTGAAPGSTSSTTNTNIATFNAAIAGPGNWGNSALNPVVIDSATQNIGGIRFTLAAGNYFIGATGGNSLLLTSGQTTNIAAGLTATNAIETINAPLVLEGANGTYTFTNDSANGAGAGAGTLNFGGGITGGAAGATVLTINGTNTNNNTISGIIGDGFATTLAITKGGTGTWVLSGPNTYTGQTRIQNGTLSVSSLNSVFGGSASSSLGAPVTVANGTIAFGNAANTGLLLYTGAGETTDRVIDLAGTTGGGTIDQSGAGLLKFTSDLTVTGVGNKIFKLQGSTAGATGEISGVIADGGGTTAVTKAGTGTWTLSGTNTYTGQTTLNGGTLIAANTLALGNVAAPLQLNTGGTLDLAIDTSISAYNATLGSGATVTIQSDLATAGTGITHTLGTLLTAGSNTINIQAGANVTGGSPVIVFGATTLGGTASSTSTFNPTSADVALTSVTGSANPGNTKTLALGGTSTGNQITGIIGDGGNGGNVKVTKSNTGTWTLSGTNTYTGQTTLNGGTLIAANTLALGNVAAPLQLNTGGTLDLAIDTSISAYNATLGTGATVTLQSDLATAGTGITHTLGTLLTAGANTINIQAGANVTGGSPVVAFGATTLGGTASSTITFNPTSADVTLTSVTGSANPGNTKTLALGGTSTGNQITGIIGDGGNGGNVKVTKSNTGTWTLSGTNTYSGGTSLTGGTLIISNASALGTGAVTNSATLDVGTTNLTLGVGSAYNQNAASTLKLTANSSSAFGKITSTVAAVVNALSTVDVTVGGYIPNNAVLTIIDTGGTGIGSVPGTITSSNAYVTFTGTNSGNNLILTANRSGSSSFGGVAANSNAANVGTTLDNVTTPSADMQNVLTALGNSSANQVASTENSLTPNADGSVTQSSFTALNQLVDTVVDHLENASFASAGQGGQAGISAGSDSQEDSLWAQGFGAYAHQGKRGLSNGYNGRLWGTAVGSDWPVLGDDLRGGLSGGYSESRIQSKDFGARTNIAAYQANLYGEYKNPTKPYYLESVLSVGFNEYNGSRYTFDRIANSSYDGQQYGFYFGGGYTFKAGKFDFTPNASIRYMRLNINSYDETDADALNLHVNSQSYDSLQPGVGAKLARSFEGKWGKFTPEVHIKYFYDTLGQKQDMLSNFAGGGGAFATQGYRPDRNTYNAGARITLLTKKNISLSLNYDFEGKQDFYSHTGLFEARYNF